MLSIEKNYSHLSVEQTTALSGLKKEEVVKRQKQYGLNFIQTRKINIFTLFIRQFTSNPLIIILAIATIVSYFLGQQISSYYIFGIIIASVFLGLWNEYSAEKTIEDLLKKIAPTTVVIRDNEKQEIPVSQVTIGDIILLSPGSIIPSDMRFIDVNNLEVDESALTGESKTIYKTADPIADRKSDKNRNIGFMGTSIVSGSGKGTVFAIGKDTEFGKIAKSTIFVKPMTDFQKGLAHFGNLIIKIVLIMTVVIFIGNFLLGHNLLDSLLFSLAIAVGLTPELLPVIVTVSLSHGAGKLAKKHVVAKQLISIENIGNMDILCTDKTGTLTEGKIDVIDFIDEKGVKNPDILKLELLCNSAIIHHKVLGNAIDAALWQYALNNKITLEPHEKKLDEESFDFNRKAMFTVVSNGKETTLIAKGALDTILSYCSHVKNKEKLHKTFLTLSQDGYRIVAVATKPIFKKNQYTWKDVADLTFQGYVTFLDIPKKSAKEALEKLHRLNVTTKIITGDNEIVTQKICKEVGMNIQAILLGSDVEKLSDTQLKIEAENANVFARITPEQKLKIIQALQSMGHAVGYLGDGINDIPSLHSADVGISVNTAVDVAKDAASVVLLHKSLDVIADGINEGRKTFNNTIKYILMATSSNFGNMFSAAGASFFLPFLPMTPTQILLNNGLYDISQTSIPSDNVDPESLLKPKHWNINFIRNYMIFFGPLSSIFDYLTFGIMLFIFHAKNASFQTGWFIESIATQTLVVFVIRTSRTPFFKSLPSKWLLFTCLSIVGIGILLPFTPLSYALGFVAPPPLYFIILLLLSTLYILLVETVKSAFLKRFSL